jgi:hypothetical protein
VDITTCSDKSQHFFQYGGVMKTRCLQYVFLCLLGMAQPTRGAMIILDFTSGIATMDPWYEDKPEIEPGYLQYVEKGVSVTSASYHSCFFIDRGLKFALESGVVNFSMDGTPFDLVSIDTLWNTSPYTFSSSNGGSIEINANGTYVFPNNLHWRSITSFQLRMQYPHQTFGEFDNLKMNVVPEPSILVLLIFFSCAIFLTRK